MTRLNLKNIVVKVIYTLDTVYLYVIGILCVERTIHTELYLMMKIGVNMLQTEIHVHIVVPPPPALFQKENKFLKNLNCTALYIVHGWF